MTDDGLEILRALLQRVKQRAHTARPQYRPLRWRRRREAHPTFMRFAAHGHNRCR